MSKRHKAVSAAAAQGKGANSSGTVALDVAQGLCPQPRSEEYGEGFYVDSSGAISMETVQRLDKQSRNKMYIKGYDSAVRNCAEALLNDGNDREYIASSFESRSIPFPSTDDTIWDVSWAFDDWNEWVAAEESESEV